MVSGRSSMNSTLGAIKKECIHSVFESIVSRNPEAISIIKGDQSITYSELNEKANHLAKDLIMGGVRKGDIIAVELDKSIELIIAILAVMKVGAAYLPIDPTYPETRIDYILEDSNVKYIITSQEYTKGSELVKEYVIDSQIGKINENPEVNCNPSDLAYVIYTSGTTGKPKGVMVEHAGFVNMCLNQISVYDLCVNERVLQFASISFDASVYEIFIALLSGSTLVLIDKEVILNIELFIKYIEIHNVTFLLLPPVFLNSLNRPEFKTVKTIVTAGEACNIADAIYFSRSKKYFNAYGPTEASVCVSLYLVNPEHDYRNYMPIGKAIPNIRFYILDENLKPVKEGEPGELYVAGVGLARGYINKSDLTQKAFIQVPGIEELKLYRTGDIVKQLPDGNLIIFGRKDQQVKILGHRIELGSIEHALLQTSKVTNAHVCSVERNGEKYLCAYFTSEEEIAPEGLRSELMKELPAFMIPNWFIRLPEFKLTKNGKIDKDAFPSPFDANCKYQEYESPFNDGTEAKIISICREVLDVSEIRLSDNFFVVGGHSLKASRLSSRINKEFNVQITVSYIYNNPYIKDILEFIKTSQPAIYQSISPSQEKRYYATSAAQKRMYMMNCTDKVDVSYNVSVVLKFANRLSREEVKSAIKSMSKRHEVLRTRFDIQFDELIQEVLPEVDVEIVDLPEIDSESLSEVAKKFVQPFDLKVAPIIKVGFCKVNQGGVAIIVDTHHIIADGTSMGILVKELVRLLEGEELPEIKLQYKDYAEWENLYYSKTDYFKNHEEYWLDTYRDIPQLKMPVDFNPKKIGNTTGERLTFKINKDLSHKLKSYAIEIDVSIYQLLLSVYYLLLSKYTNQQNIVVGTAVANRVKDEVQDMMGMFVNTMALRAIFDVEIYFSYFVRYIKTMVLEAFEFQEYPFELLISKLGVSGNATKVPLIDTLFIVQNIDFFDDKAMGGLSMKYENATATSKFDFSFFVIDQKDGFVFDVEYNTSKYSSAYITKLADNFIELAEKSVSNPSAPLEDINLIDDKVLTEIRSVINLNSEMEDFDFDL